MNLFRIIAIIAVALNSQQHAIAGPGDTLFTIRSHDKVHMNWYGNFDRWAQFPTSNSGPFYRVYMEYTLGCPTTGCSEWDYTTQIFLRHNTGLLDSTAQQVPQFTLNGNSPDSLGLSLSPTFLTVWNSNSQETDTVWQNQLSVLLRLNPSSPQQVTDTLIAYPAWFWYYIFDNQGQISDSLFVAADTSLYQQFTTVYTSFNVLENYELGRVITPYAGTFSNTWKWTYRFDITDFQHLLKDSVQIRAHYSGYQDGFTVTLDFIFIEGSPAWPVLQMKKMFGGGFPYGNTANPIGNYMTPVLHSKALGTSRTETLFNITGHGFGGNENCAEFCPKNYHLFVAGQQRASKLVWNDQCGWNPIFPQGGTWVYNRSNWCPGSAVSTFRNDISQWLSTQPTEVRFDMQNFTNINNNYSSYIAEAYIVDFANPHYAVEASLEEIISPSQRPDYRRFNPICGQPEIKVKNDGATAIQSLTISYGVIGATPASYQWNGTIPPREEKNIVLPALNNWYPGVNNPDLQFFAEIIQVNGQHDELSFNNLKVAPFQAPPVFPDSLILFFKTNNRPNENNWVLEDNNGAIVQQRNNFPVNQIVRDTLRLSPGCYRFKFFDSAGDGISFWANSAAGSGTLRFQEITTSGIQILRNFPGDFGSGIDFSFTVGYTLPIEEPNKSDTWKVFPNPTQENIFISAPSPVNGSCELRLIDLSGRLVQRLEFYTKGESEFLWKPENSLPGSYILQLINQDQLILSKPIIIVPN